MPKRILVVDDDQDFVQSLTAYLQSVGYEVQAARNGTEGLRLAQLHPPDLILLDVMMEERTEGFFTLQDLRRTPELTKIPVFVISAVYAQLDNFQVPPEASWLRHDAFFSKPLELPELLEKIRQRIGPGRLAEAEVSRS